MSRPTDCSYCRSKPTPTRCRYMYQ